MATTARPFSLQHPERIHPALWRATQLACTRHNAMSTGFPQLDNELPDRGWPLGSLIEILPSQPGVGEMSLLHPALARLDSKRSIALVNPPYSPYFHCWRNWRLQQHRLLWIRPQTCSDTLWATEQILRHNACSAVVCWADSIRLPALRRLHLAAQQTETLLFLQRPYSAAQQTSAAPLRLRLRPNAGGLEVFIAKRRGPCPTHPILVTFPFTRVTAGASIHHAALDQPISAHAQPGRLFSAVAG
ncbi:MAG: translesion DNA synthesis-associated protein ImuA [Pusillimonas sp.]